MRNFLSLLKKKKKNWKPKWNTKGKQNHNKNGNNVTVAVLSEITTAKELKKIQRY